MWWIVFNFCYYSTFVLVPIIVFVFFSKDDNFHSSGGLLYFIKFIFGKREISKKKKQLRKSLQIEDFNSLEEAKWISDETQSDRLSLSATDQNGNQLNIELRLRNNHLMDIYMCLRIDQNIYVLPNKYQSLIEEHPIWTKSIGSSHWRCPWLNVEILEPFKRCRLTFNGFLMGVSPGKNGTVEHFRMNLMWSCCSKPNITLLDDDLNLLTNCLAKTTWRDGRWLDLLGDEKGYMQFGSLRGFISGEHFTETEFNMACVKRRYWGSLESITLKKYVRIFAATENGRLFDFGIKCLKNGCQELQFGHVLTHNGSVYPLQNSDVRLNGIDHSISNKITIHLKANNKLMRLVLTLQNSIKLVNNSVHGFKHEICSAECSVDTFSGFAILDHWNSFKGDEIKRPLPIIKALRCDNPPNVIIAPIDSDAGKILELSGGKGNSLALMKNLEDSEVLIPDGFIITTYAFQQQIRNNFQLRKCLALLEDIVLGKEEGNIENACETTVEIFQEQSISPSISQKICDELMKFRRKHNDSVIPYLRWAVRSSAIGEDSEEFSAAGQNETFLGCQTDKDVLRKICNCWGSLFTFQSVMYRKQHGLPIRTSMAVVVQQMIPAESAGVLFTSHPSNSNPAKMLITSNFGLGETVVSGEADPDTIILSKTYDGVVTLESYTLGAKNTSMVMNRYGVHKKTLDDQKIEELSIPTELAVKLGNIGVKLEEAFGGPRDIEWALFKGQLYILQSRPITTLSQWSDYELLHELDTPHISNDMYYTRANVGEVAPNALTPLTQTTVMDYIEKSFQIQMFGKYDPYVNINMVYTHHFSMIELLAGLYARPRAEIDTASEIQDLSVFGHPVLNEEINKKAIARYGVFSTSQKLNELLMVAKQLWQTSSKLKELKKMVDEVQIEIDQKDTVIEIYNKIDRYLKNTYIAISLGHLFVTVTCIFYQTFVLTTLVGKQKKLTPEHHNDLALILSSCNNVISADIPIKIEEISQVLKKSKLAQEFISVDTEHGLEWIEANSKEAYVLMKNFFKDHGHRVLGETELSIDPWGQDPSGVIEMIKANCKMDSSNAKKASDPNKDIVKDLQSPTTNITRAILRYLIKKNRAAVGNREISKSCLVKATNNMRIAYKELATRMTLEGIIPHDNLIFHLTHYEVWQVLNKQNLNLIPKAIRRQRLYPKWNKLRFPEIMYGLPVPEMEDELPYENLGSDVVCKGTSVCVGEVTARACVITSLSEIGCLKEGDVLITRSTDIGWSPYFPILSGIVTELGGLVSHGAVVAREYGLPCIIGTKNATKMFKTGDTIHLSGKSGTLVLVSK